MVFLAVPLAGEEKSWARAEQCKDDQQVPGGELHIYICWKAELSRAQQSKDDLMMKVSSLKRLKRDRAKHLLSRVKPKRSSGEQGLCTNKSKDDRQISELLDWLMGSRNLHVLRGQPKSMTGG